MGFIADRFNGVDDFAPCPICGGADWCLIRRDGKEAICPRVVARNEIPGVGYIHKLNGRVRIPRNQRAKEKLGKTALGILQCTFAAAIKPSQVIDLAGQFGVKPKILTEFGIGWNTSDQCYTFPMSDVSGIRGISYRRPDGQKFSLTGSSNALFIPESQWSGKTLFCPEGVSDTSVLRYLGFPAVGRHNNVGGGDHLAEYARECGFKEIVLVADNDDAGLEGVEVVSEHLKDFEVTWIMPSRYKDIRETWQQNEPAHWVRTCILTAVDGTYNKWFHRVDKLAGVA